MLDRTKPYVEKIRYTDAELAGHAHKLDVKLQSLTFLCLLCACLPSPTLEWISGVASPKIWGGAKMFDFRRITLSCLEKRLSKHKMTIFSKNLGGHGPFGPPPGYAYGVNWPTTLRESKDGVNFFTFKFECHNTYNKLLLWNSEDGDMVWCNKNNSERVFCVFFKKKNPFLSKKTKTRIWKNNRWLFFIKKRVFLCTGSLSILFCDFPLIGRSGTSHATISLTGFAPHT